MLALLIGLPFFFTGWKLPPLLQVPVDSFSALNTPLAMVVIGCNIAQIRFREMFQESAVFGLSALRLLLVPAVFFGVAWLCRPAPSLLLSCIIQASAPVAANTVLFATQFGADSRLAAKAVAVTTLLSILTMPVFVVAGQAAGNLL